MEAAMPQRQKPIDERLVSKTPVIDMQDLEHNPTPQTRVPDTGVTIEPKLDTDDLRDFAKEDEAMFKALEEIEKQISQRPPGWYSIPTDVTNPFTR
jgi:hypothetical protein